MGARSDRIDALRGLAVFGIMLVNVFSVVYGFGSYRFGTLDPGIGVADQWTVFLVASFAEQKFSPIFSFLFGAGFALQTGGRRQPGALLDAARFKYRRRMQWLLACGVLHGCLIWFGDILTAYALVGFWLLSQAGRRLSDMLRTLKILVVVNLILMLFLAMLEAAAQQVDLPGALDYIAGEMRAHAIYTQGSWSEITALRLSDYFANVAGLLIFLPRLMLLFLLGAMAVRLGWLMQPQRHQGAWRKVMIVGLMIGLPLNLWWGVVALQETADPLFPPAGAALARSLAEVAGPCLAAAYIAFAMLAPRAILGWLAPVGRMALSNYLMQSVLLTFLLQGFGLGLGAVLSRAQLMLLCAAIMLVQLTWSVWWLKRHAQGPMEALWRRYTARGTATRDA